jgi:hypothetical protein
VCSVKRARRCTVRYGPMEGVAARGLCRGSASEMAARWQDGGVEEIG